MWETRLVNDLDHVPCTKWQPMYMFFILYPSYKRFSKPILLDEICHARVVLNIQKLVHEKTKSCSTRWLFRDIYVGANQWDYTKPLHTRTFDNYYTKYEDNTTVIYYNDIANVLWIFKNRYLYVISIIRSERLDLTSDAWDTIRGWPFNIYGGGRKKFASDILLKKSLFLTSAL